jgi:hypothetical protein
MPTPEEIAAQYGAGPLGDGTFGWANNGYSIQYTDPTTGNTSPYTGQFIPLYGTLPAGVSEYSIPDFMKQGRAAASAPPMNINQMLNTPATAPTTNGWTGNLNPPPAPAPSGNIGGQNGPFPPSLSWLPALMAMMPPRPAPPRPISSIFNPSSFAPSTSAFPGGIGGLNIAPIQADVMGSQVKADTDLNDITSKAMSANEALSRQAGPPLGQYGAPPAPQGFDSITSQLFPASSSTGSGLAAPWLLNDLTRNSPAARTGK